MRASSLEIAYIVGSRNATKWLRMKPTMYYKNGLPFGLIAIECTEDGIVINSIAKNDEKFTFAMLRFLITTIKKNKRVALMSTCEDSCINKLMDTYHEHGKESYFTKGV